MHQLRAQTREAPPVTLRRELQEGLRLKAAELLHEVPLTGVLERECSVEAAELHAENLYNTNHMDALFMALTKDFRLVYGLTPLLASHLNGPRRNKRQCR